MPGVHGQPAPARADRRARALRDEGRQPNDAPFVMDASVTAAWLLPDEASEHTRRL